ncbi:hypothetical protein LB450_04950 [Psychroflexus sp. CAK1W]|uniref:hypothetical protein n=1 Tax=Psychroflexus curvus TaxID=2873595 RepID=UPI001CCCD1E0|nr:hypothetical protein [Psychroflexus curvus]MBZ9627441.1 hypothetical protein [Psychroflexus curvus]
MEKREIHNYDELEINTFSKNDGERNFISVGDFKYELNIEFEFSISELFKNRFKGLGIKPTDKIEFINILFRKKFIFTNKEFFKPTLDFIKCYFNFSPSFRDKVFENKIKFKLCDFERFYMNNTTFKEYLEFYNCRFFEKAIIIKCSFDDNVVFTKSNFHGNCLFTYSSFEKLGIFSRAKFHDENKKPTALDLSQTIINGQLVFFETVLGNYKAFKIDSDSTNYDKTINDGDVIPMQNKRETFRIIKDQLLQQNNIIEAEKYGKLEKQTLLEEKNLDAIYEDDVLKTFKILLSDYFVLKLNKYSNNFKTSWLYAFIFTLSVAFISHSFLSISKNYEFDDFIKLIKLINITDFSFYEEVDSTELYIVYFLAKISIGFGIYQLIQAFRKYK